MAALATLEIEGCGLTTRSIQQISSSLQPESSLVKLCIGELVLAFHQCTYLQSIENAGNRDRICTHIYQSSGKYSTTWMLVTQSLCIYYVMQVTTTQLEEVPYPSYFKSSLGS